MIVNMIKNLENKMEKMQESINKHLEKSDGKASVYNAGDPGSILGLGRSPGGENGNPLQYSCLGNPPRAWWAAVHGIAKSWTRLSTHAAQTNRSAY